MTVVMEDNKALSSLSYLSVCFAPVLLPFIVLLASSNETVKKHVKSSLISQLIPIVFLPFMFFSFFTSAVAFDEFPVLMIVLFILHGITSLIVFIWNIVKGIKVLAN